MVEDGQERGAGVWDGSELSGGRIGLEWRSRGGERATGRAQSLWWDRER